MAEAELQEAAEFASDVIKEESGGERKPPWGEWTAIFAMVLALFSAVGALFAGISANEALLERTKEIAELSDRNSEQVRLEIIKQGHEHARIINRKSDADFQMELDRLKEQIEKLDEEINEEEKGVGERMRTHEILAIGVTILSIAITFCGMAMVTLSKPVWFCGLTTGIVGFGFVAVGFYTLIPA